MPLADKHRGCGTGHTAPSGDATSPRRPSPYRLITTDDLSKTLGQGEMRCYPTLIEAANAFVKTTEPYKQIVYDDGRRARELNRAESLLLENVAAKLGYDVEEVGS